MGTLTYPKIETLFDRRDDFTVDTERLRRPEFGLIDKWLLTEKIDGTNVRLRFERRDNGVKPFILGKTDNASLHPGLLNTLNEECARMEPYVAELMYEHGLHAYTLFGEGYGPKIQSGGRYRTATNDQGFVLFDVNANDTAWLDEQQITATADRLRLERVPYVTDGPLPIGEIVSIVRGGFMAVHVQERDLTFDAEGVVARTPVPLYDRRGERVIWKLKAKDFRAGKR